LRDQAGAKLQRSRPQKKATSSKASQKLSTNDVFAGESQTKKIIKKKAGRWRKFRKRQQRERRSVAGTKRTGTRREREREREREKIPKP
jgi:hypothetical protein